MDIPVKIKGWTCTDNDCLQYQKQISDTCFKMIQYNEMFGNYLMFFSYTIELLDYTEKEIDGHISGYYNSLKDLKNKYPKDSVNGIIAECIFEQELFGDAIRSKIYSIKDEEEIKKDILEYLKNN